MPISTRPSSRIGPSLRAAMESSTLATIPYRSSRNAARAPGVIAPRRAYNNRASAYRLGRCSADGSPAASAGAAQRGALLGLRQGGGDVVAVIGRQAESVQRALAGLARRVAEAALEPACCARLGWQKHTGGRPACCRKHDPEPRLAAFLDAGQPHQRQQPEQGGSEE